MSSEFCLNFVTQKFTKGASNWVTEWLPLSVTERLSRRQLTFTGSVCAPLRHTVYINPGGPGPNILQRGPIRQSPNDYAATCHKVLNALRTLRRPPYIDVIDRCNLVTNFWSCMLANLRNQKSFSCAENGSIAWAICIKIVAIRCQIFSTKCTKKSTSAGAHIVSDTANKHKPSGLKNSKL